MVQMEYQAEPLDDFNMTSTIASMGVVRKGSAGSLAK